MSSEATLQAAQAERQRANDLESKAQKTLDTAQKQAQRLRDRAQAHTEQASRFTQNGQSAEPDHQADLLRSADAERQEAANLENQAQQLLLTAQQEADGMRNQAQVHINEVDRLTGQAQQEQQAEAKKIAEEASEEQKRRDKIKDILF